jgi:MFS family permease
VYLVLQGIGTSKCCSVENVCCVAQDGEIAPMFWGTLSDYFGRRPTTAGCLLVLSLSCIGLALVPTSAYWLLMVLRCLQAAGSASTIAIGNIHLFLLLFLFSMSVGAGVVGDVSSGAERAGFFGLFMLGPLVS